MAGKAPAFQFYPGDWRRDTQVQMASMETRGVWIEMLCCMWDAPERGILSGTIKDLARLLGCEPEVLSRAISEIDQKGIANVTCNGNVTNCNTHVTVVNRRMYRDAQTRINTRDRVRKHRAKTDEKEACNSNVTPASSSSSSSTSISCKEKPPIIPLELPDYMSAEYQQLKTAGMEILSYLNRKANKNFPATYFGFTEILKRLHEGRLKEQFIAIIDKKLKDPGFNRNWMRPETLFAEKNFDKYLMENEEDYEQHDRCHDGRGNGNGRPGNGMFRDSAGRVDKTRFSVDGDIPEPVDLVVKPDAACVP